MSLTFDEALAQFQQFLEKNGWPRDVTWITSSNVLLSGSPQIHIKLPVPPENDHSARQLFAIGMSRQLGVLFHAISDGEGLTFSYIWVPQNQEEAQRALMPRDIKLSVSTGTSRLPAKIVRSQARWLYLGLKYWKQQKLKGELIRTL